MQIVFLSARPAVLEVTLGFVRAHLPFIERFLVVTPASLEPGMRALGLDVVTDQELLAGEGPSDHAVRNYALRTALARCPAVEEVFLSSDDDYRPLVPLDVTTFVRDGRHRRYTCGWLDDWEQRGTAFDRSQLAMRQVLGLHGWPRLAYTSHMPQLIDKRLYGEVAGLLAAAAAVAPLDEWSGYFNVAGHLHPERFEDPEPYLTLGWPEDLSTWQPTLEPAALQFENHHPQHYAAGEVFEGIDPADTSYAAAVGKVVRWRSYELAVLAGERRAALAPAPESGPIGSALRQARARAVGDPGLRERQQRAATAAALRALRRSP